MSGKYRFVLCDGCTASLSVGESWEDGTKIQCDACGNVQELGSERDL